MVRVADAADVATVVRYARDTDTSLAVRAGGHSIMGHSSTDGGLVVDLSRLKRIDVDPDGRTAWADGGVLAGEYNAETSNYGLVTGFGDTPSVGVSGITLGGGVGFLHRKLGLTIDSLLAAEVVTADGEIRVVDDENEPDLFWALRGGGGNFGVVTRLHFRLHPERRAGQSAGWAGGQSVERGHRLQPQYRPGRSVAPAVLSADWYSGCP